MTDGKILRSHLRINDVSVDSFCKKLGISRQTLYNWYEKTFFDDIILDKLEKIGGVQKSIFRPIINKVSETPTDYKPNNDYMDALKENEMLKQLLSSKESEIVSLKEIISMLKSEDVPSTKRKYG